MYASLLQTLAAAILRRMRLMFHYLQRRLPTLSNIVYLLALGVEAALELHYITVL
jgi:hypothetical protein